MTDEREPEFTALPDLKQPIESALIDYIAQIVGIPAAFFGLRSVSELDGERYDDGRD
jgi:hypothetical protein